MTGYTRVFKYMVYDINNYFVGHVNDIVESNLINIETKMLQQISSRR